MQIGTRYWLICGVLAASLLGCAAPVRVDGYDLGSSAWARDAAALRARASFDLACPTQDVHLQVIAASNVPRAFGASSVGVAKTVGAVGCGGRATYMRLGIYGEWVLNGASRAASGRRNVAASDQ